MHVYPVTTLKAYSPRIHPSRNLYTPYSGKPCNYGIFNANKVLCKLLGYMEGWRGTYIPEERTQKLRTMAKAIA
jgi:hypothetical protein